MPPGAGVGSSPGGQPDGTGQESLSNGDDGAPLGRELEIARLLKAIKDHGVKGARRAPASTSTSATSRSPRTAASSGCV